MDRWTSSPVANLERLRVLIGGDPHPIVPHKLSVSIEERAGEFISISPFLMLATSNEQGQLDVSPKGDAPGFVLVENEKTLWIPDRPGNKLAFGLQNILANPRVGVLFLVPGTEETLRVNGRAELHSDPDLLNRLSCRKKPALVAIRVEVEECFFHCAKALKRSKLWQEKNWPERFKISFGELLAPKMGGDGELAKQIDRAVEEDYQNRL